MRIAVVNRYHPSDVLGGSEVQCRLLMGQWRALGHEVEYMALDGCGQTGPASDGFGPFRRLSPRLGIPSFGAFRKRLMEFRPDVVYLRSFGQLWMLGRICREVGVPSVYNTCNITDLQCLIPGELAAVPWEWPARLRGAALRWLNHGELFRMPVVTLNRDHATWINTLGGRAKPIYNSMVDVHEGGLPPKERLIAWVANIKERKRPEEFLELVRHLSGRGWRFVMVGSLQNRKDEYWKMIRDTEASCPDFSWLGSLKVEEVDALLARASILVNTCRPEGFGNNFIQAWLAACPTVSLEFDADGIMQNEGLGFCPGSSAGMTMAVERLMEDETLRTTMGKSARRWAKAHHDPETNAREYLRVFEWVKLSQWEKP
ncbi:MAG: glycosyltransferase family 4 protein [Planctomycetota bacterium]